MTLSKLATPAAHQAANDRTVGSRRKGGILSWGAEPWFLRSSTETLLRL